LKDHGLKSNDAFKNLTPKALIESAKEAIAIGKVIGEKVIVMSCSTGGTFSAILAPYDQKIAGLIMYSPNIDIADPTSELVTGPWGNKLIRLAMKGEYNHINYDSLPKQYWMSQYHVDGIIALKYLIEQEMTRENFEKITTPIYIGYYPQDDVVSVPDMKKFYEQISSPEGAKEMHAFENSGHHVISSYIFSKSVPEIEESTKMFVENVLKISPVQ